MKRAATIPLKAVRLYRGADDCSHFEDLTLPLCSNGDEDWLSPRYAAQELVFSDTPAGYAWSWVHPPRRQWVITIQGEIEIEVSSGEKRCFYAGVLLLAEDTTGKGHITRVTSKEDWRCVYVPVAENIQFP